MLHNSIPVVEQANLRKKKFKKSKYDHNKVLRQSEELQMFSPKSLLILTSLSAAFSKRQRLHWRREGQASEHGAASREVGPASGAARQAPAACCAGRRRCACAATPRRQRSPRHGAIAMSNAATIDKCSDTLCYAPTDNNQAALLFEILKLHYPLPSVCYRLFRTPHYSEVKVNLSRIYYLFILNYIFSILIHK